MPASVPARPATAWDHGRRRESLVEILLAEIFQGRLRAGQRLVAQDLADQFGVSQTPVREALITLAGVGVIDLLPNRGAVVRTVRERDVRDVCQVRRVLECEAVRTSCGRLDPAEIAFLETELATLSATPDDVARARTLDSRLHDTIAAGCGNLVLAREIGRLKLLFRAFRDVSWEREEARSDFRRIPGEAAEHREILFALRNLDADGAAAAMARHIQSGEAYWAKALFPTTTSPP